MIQTKCSIGMLITNHAAIRIYAVPAALTRGSVPADARVARGLSREMSSAKIAPWNP
jgi:hypothetical protein